MDDKIVELKEIYQDMTESDRADWLSHARGIVSGGRCEHCGQPFEQKPRGHGRRFCTNACRQAEYRRRKGLATAAQAVGAGTANPPG